MLKEKPPNQRDKFILDSKVLQEKVPIRAERSKLATTKMQKNLVAKKKKLRSVDFKKPWRAVLQNYDQKRPRPIKASLLSLQIHANQKPKKISKNAGGTWRNWALSKKKRRESP